MVVLLALVLETVILVATQGDPIATDPLWYADLAHSIAHDPGAVFADPSNHPFLMRIGLTVPLAACYRLFGVSPLVTNLPVIAAALGVMLVVHAAAPTPRAKRIALLLCLGSAPLVRQAAHLYPDLPAATLMACSVLWLGRRRPVAAMAAWFAAFLVKETALWCGPVWIYVLIRDRRELRRYAPALAVGAVLATAYLVLCAVVWGDPLARFTGIAALANGHDWSMARTHADWAARLVWEPPLELARMFGFLLVPAAFARDRLWLVFTGSVIGLLWFGSTSLGTYEPLPLLPRMMAVALPGLLVLATLGFDRLVERRLAVAVLAVLVAAPAVRYVGYRLRAVAPETAAYRVLRAEGTRPEPLIVVCGSARGVALGELFFGFEVPPNVRLVTAEAFARAPPPARATVRVLVNQRRDPAPGIDLDALGTRLVSRGHIQLYDAGDGTRLHRALNAAPHG